MNYQERIIRIAKLAQDLKLADITKDEAIEDLKNASFNDIADEMWEFYCFARDIKSILKER